MRPFKKAATAFNCSWGALSTIILGILALAWTGATLVVAGTVFGIYLLLSGVFQLTAAFAPHVPAQLRVLGLVSGALSILLGLICFRGPAQSILLLALWIGFGRLLRGIMTTAAALSGPAMPPAAGRPCWACSPSSPASC